MNLNYNPWKIKFLSLSALSLPPSLPLSLARSHSPFLPPSLSDAHFIFCSFPACSKASLMDITGTFSSPGYPRPYPSHTECVWTITAPQGMLIALQFPHFNVYGWGSTCLEHYVTVYDVHNGKLTEITT